VLIVAYDHIALHGSLLHGHLEGTCETIVKVGESLNNAHTHIQYIAIYHIQRERNVIAFVTGA
jgi:hypothetical protein